ANWQNTAARTSTRDQPCTAVQNDIVPEPAGDLGALSIDFTPLRCKPGMDIPRRTPGAGSASTRDPEVPRLHQLRGPQVVQVNDAQQAVLLVDDHERGNSFLFHERNG